jgi:hypothetical protein
VGRGGGGGGVSNRQAAQQCTQASGQVGRQAGNKQCRQAGGQAGWQTSHTGIPKTMQCHTGLQCPFAVGTVQRFGVSRQKKLRAAEGLRRLGHRSRQVGGFAGVPFHRRPFFTEQNCATTIKRRKDGITSDKRFRSTQTTKGGGGGIADGQYHP